MQNKVQLQKWEQVAEGKAIELKKKKSRDRTKTGAKCFVFKDALEQRQRDRERDYGPVMKEKEVETVFEALVWKESVSHTAVTIPKLI